MQIIPKNIVQTLDTYLSNFEVGIYKLRQQVTSLIKQSDAWRTALQRRNNPFHKQSFQKSEAGRNWEFTDYVTMLRNVMAKRRPLQP